MSLERRAKYAKEHYGFTEEQWRGPLKDELERLKTLDSAERDLVKMVRKSKPSPPPKPKHTYIQPKDEAWEKLVAYTQKRLAEG